MVFTIGSRMESFLTVQEIISNYPAKVPRAGNYIVIAEAYSRFNLPKRLELYRQKTKNMKVVFKFEKCEGGIVEQGSIAKIKEISENCKKYTGLEAIVKGKQRWK